MGHNGTPTARSTVTYILCDRWRLTALSIGLRSYLASHSFPFVGNNGCICTRTKNAYKRLCRSVDVWARPAQTRCRHGVHPLKRTKKLRTNGSCTQRQRRNEKKESDSDRGWDDDIVTKCVCMCMYVARLCRRSMNEHTQRQTHCVAYRCVYAELLVAMAPATALQL